MAGLGGLGGRRRRTEEYRSCCARQTPCLSPSFPPSLQPACLSYCLTASFYPHAGERKGEKRGRGKKQHLIRSSYSTSFKGTLNDVFLGRRQLHITSHAQGTSESWRRAGAQDADTAALGMASFLRSEEEEEGERRIRRGGLSPSPFFLWQRAQRQKRGAFGLRHLSLAGRWGRRRRCRRRARVCCNCSDRF